MKRAMCGGTGQRLPGRPVQVASSRLRALLQALSRMPPLDVGLAKPAPMLTEIRTQTPARFAASRGRAGRRQGAGRRLGQHGNRLHGRTRPTWMRLLHLPAVPVVVVVVVRMEATISMAGAFTAAVAQEAMVEEERLAGGAAAVAAAAE